MTDYPISMPDGVAASRFYLPDSAYTTHLASGDAFHMETGIVRWAAEFTTGRVGRARGQRWQAFFDKLRNGGTFFCGDPEKPFPLAYRRGFAGLDIAGGGGPFAGLAAVEALTATTISLSGLPADFEMTEGDMIGLVEDDYRGLYRVQNDVTGESDGTATIEVWPPVLTEVFTTDATANFASPVCVMIRDGGVPEDTRVRGAAPMRFAAVQVVA